MFRNRKGSLVGRGIPKGYLPALNGIAVGKYPGEKPYSMLATSSGKEASWFLFACSLFVSLPMFFVGLNVENYGMFFLTGLIFIALPLSILFWNYLVEKHWFNKTDVERLKVLYDTILNRPGYQISKKHDFIDIRHKIDLMYFTGKGFSLTCFSEDFPPPGEVRFDLWEESGTGKIFVFANKEKIEVLFK